MSTAYNVRVETDRFESLEKRQQKDNMAEIFMRLKK